MVLDKTGTVTEGKPKVTDLLPAPGRTEEELLCVAASLEALSEHPLAQAIVAEAKDRSIPLCPVEQFEAIPRQRYSGRYSGRTLPGGQRLFPRFRRSVRRRGRTGRGGQNAAVLHLQR